MEDREDWMPIDTHTEHTTRTLWTSLYFLSMIVPFLGSTHSRTRPSGLVLYSSLFLFGGRGREERGKGKETSGESQPQSTRLQPACLHHDSTHRKAALTGA